MRVAVPPVASVRQSWLATAFRWSPVAILLVAVFSYQVLTAGIEPTAKEDSMRLIGATTVLTELSSGLPFNARVDTGATTCSIHYQDYEIENESPNPMENIGKPIRILIQNHQGGSAWIEAEIHDHVMVRTSDNEEGRYKVRLAFRWNEVQKSVLVTLNDRGRMQYPLLIGRNFLRNDFLVNVNINPSE